VLNELFLVLEDVKIQALGIIPISELGNIDRWPSVLLWRYSLWSDSCYVKLFKERESSLCQKMKISMMMK